MIMASKEIELKVIEERYTLYEVMCKLISNKKVLIKKYYDLIGLEIFIEDGVFKKNEYTYPTSDDPYDQSILTDEEVWQYIKLILKQY
jgi:hypothetical protein